MYDTVDGFDGNGRPVPFEQIISSDHRIYVVGSVLSPDGQVLSSGIGITGGEVSVDRTSKIRRSVKASLVPYGDSGTVGPAASAAQIEALQTSLIPEQGDNAAALAPYGNLLQVMYGIGIPGYETFAFWSLGRFRISETSVNDSGTPSLEVVGYDSSRAISRSKLLVGYQATGGANWGDQIIALARVALPTIGAKPHNVVDTVPAAGVWVPPGEDPWDTMDAWAKIVGCEVYIDVDGDIVIAEEAEPGVDPIVWTYNDASVTGNAALLSAGKVQSDDPGYNGVVMTSESTTIAAPLRSEAWDANPASPTYYLGPYGKVPSFSTSQYAATQAQLDTAARVELKRIAGVTEQVQMAVIPHPCHEAGDVVRIVRPLAKIDAVSALQSFTIPLTADSPMTIQCASRRVLQ